MHNGKTNCGEDAVDDNLNPSKYQNNAERTCDECGKKFLQNTGWACKTEVSCFTPTQSAPIEYVKYCSRNCSSIRGMKVRGKKCE